MNVAIEPGTYVLAVSGGVDSMVLLDLLRRQPKTRLIVAHYDHGIRPDSVADRQLVQAVSKELRLPFVYAEGNLGNRTSEAKARKHRYDFLKRVQKAANARAVVTAHHKDDLLETAILNLLRGTGRRGLVSLKNTDVIKRPLIDRTKQEIINYAQANGLKWREDSTNQDTRYARNYVRHKLLPGFSVEDKERLLQIIDSLHQTHQEIESHLMNYLHVQPATNKLDRHQFIMLPHDVSREIMLAWLRHHGAQAIDRRSLERLVTAGKTLSPGQQTDVDKGLLLKITKDGLALMPSDR